MRVSTNPQSIQELLTRGVENIYPSKTFLAERLAEGKQLSLYTGYDPTAPTLHIGHGITLLKLRQFQALGHKIIFLIGDFTGMIGDPTDKSAARQKLTREEVLKNAALYQEQASRVLNFEGDNPAEIRYNSEWWGETRVADLLELASNITVPRLLERDMFQKRMEEGKTIYLHELLYPVLQGYDSVAMGIDGEVGGNDQTFNMLMGRTLLKSIGDKEKFVLSGKLLTDTSGAKMSKTAGNMIAFSDTPEDMFGKVMAWGDDMIRSGFELCTLVSMTEIKDIQQQLDLGHNPRDFKLRLAFEITQTFLGETAARQGQTYFANVIQGGNRPTEISKISPSALDIITVLVEAGFARSHSEAKRVIAQGGVRLNTEKVSSTEIMVKRGDIVQKGKLFFVQII